MEDAQVGIEVFTTSTSGFTGILKHRYSDFQVFEVDLGGKTAHLTDATAPDTAAEAAAAAPAAQLTSASIAELTAAFADIAGADNAALLNKLLLNIQQQQEQQSDAPGKPASAPSSTPQLEIDLQPVSSKEQRKAIHEFLKTDARLPRLVTDTVAAAASVDGQSQQQHNTIRVRLAGSSSSSGADGGGRQRGGGAAGGKGQKRGRKGSDWRNEPPWPGGQLKHVRFVMLKENMDTQAALTVIGRMLHVHSSAFGFAGTKDKRGVTTQFLTLLRTQPAKLAALNPKLRGVKLGNFEFAGGPLQLGQLRGNTFRILMRDVNTSDDAHIEAAVSELRQKGFVNYFGLQRFGTGAVPTHRVGGALLRGEWKGAADLILRGSPDERPEYRAARDLYLNKGDIQGALKALPTFLVGERAVLQGLSRNGTNYLQALQGIPRTLRSMYLHAWQSWVWNRAASERIRRFGAAAVVAGDLVLLQQQQQAGDAGPAAAAGADAAAAAAGDATQGADAEQQQEEDAAVLDEADVADMASAAGRLSCVHEVTPEEAAAGRFSMQDVVLPLPGGRVRYPSHEAGWRLYCRLAAADGVWLPGMTAEDEAAALAAAAAAAAADGGGQQDGGEQQQQFVKHPAKEFQLSNLTGDYRRLLHVPSDMRHSVLRYSNYDQDDLLPSDWTELQRQQGPQQKRPRRDRDEQQQQQEAAAAAAPQEADAADTQQPAAADTQQPPAAAADTEQPPAVAAAVDTEQQAAADTQQPAAADTQQPAAAAASADTEQQAAADTEQQAAADTQQPAAAAADTEQPAPASTTGPAAAKPRELVGVVLEFTLPSSCYATMLIRELTKSSTSKASHREMSTKG